jgi:hypothetical protein
MALLAYDPSACPCCVCGGSAEYQVRGINTDYGDSVDPATYRAFLQFYDDYASHPHGPPAGRRFFRTMVGRGFMHYKYGASSMSLEPLVLLSHGCSFIGRNTFGGSGVNDRFYPYPNSWSTVPNPFLGGGLSPLVVASSCLGAGLEYIASPPLALFQPNDLFGFLFYVDLLSANRARATYSGDPGEAFTPRGEFNLLNEMFDLDFLEVGRADFEADTWRDVVYPMGQTSFFTPPSVSSINAFGYRRARVRGRFLIPRSGLGVRVKFDVMWTPSGGTTVLFDQISKHWDRAVPEGYDEADAATWPTTEWAELPEATTAGAYSVANVKIECDVERAPTAPGDISGYSE